MRVAMIGAGGTMGRGMSLNLLRAGIEVRAWNRSAEKLGPLEEKGASGFTTAAEAAEDADLVITMLSDTDAVLDVMTGREGVLGGVADGTVWVQSSTIGIEGIERCRELADREGLILIDAPVLGTKKPAEEGELVILASGPPNSRERVEPIFEAIGKRTVWVDEEPGAASRLKVVVNSWIVSVVEGTAEAIALAEGLGLDPSLVLDALSGGTLDLPYMQMKGKMMIDRDFPVSFRLALAAKDARLSVEAAGKAGLDLPMLRAISERMAETAEEHGDEDLAAAFLGVAP
jgi:3-hydroxyisobutyrate dehydrogenase